MKLKTERRIEILSGRIYKSGQWSDLPAKLSNGRAILETIWKQEKEYHKTVYHFVFTPIQAEDIAGLAIYRISKMVVDEGVTKDIGPLWMVCCDNKQSRNEMKTMKRTKAQYPVERRALKSLTLNSGNGITNWDAEVPMGKHGPICEAAHENEPRPRA